MLYRIVLRLELLLLATFTGIIVLTWGLGQLLPAAPLYRIPMSTLTPGIYALDTFRGVLLNVTKNIRIWDSETAVSPNGHYLAYSSSADGNAEIYVLDLRTGNRERLTGDFAADFSPAWSPDGEWLAFASGRGSSVDIYIIEAGGGTPRQIASTPDTDFSPAWSPNGWRLAFVRTESYGFGIYISDVYGSGVPQRLTFYEGQNIFPAWSPDGDWVAFVSNQTGQLNVYMLPVACLHTPGGCESANPRQLTGQGFDRLEALSWSADGRLRFWAQTGTAWELYALDEDCDLQPGGCVPQQLTHLARSLLAGRRQIN